MARDLNQVVESLHGLNRVAVAQRVRSQAAELLLVPSPVDNDRVAESLRERVHRPPI